MKNKGKCQSAQRTPTTTLPPSDPKLSWNLGSANPLQPISSPSPSYIKKKTMKPKGMYGENQLSDISAPEIQMAAIVLAAVTNRGVDIAARYHNGAKRHSRERLNSRRSSSLPPVINVTRIAAIKEAGTPRRTSNPPNCCGSYVNGMSKSFAIPNRSHK